MFGESKHLEHIVRLYRRRYKKMFIKALNLFSWLIFLFCSSAFSATETLTVTTYYPTPLGVYSRLATTTLGVGDTNGANGLEGADAPNPATHPGDAWIAGNVGIGTNTTANKLDVSGSTVIGATYAGATVAPANSLLVEGDVGVGVTAANLPPNANLEINGVLKLMPTASAPTASGGQTLQGTLYYDSVDKRLKYNDGSGWKILGGVSLGPVSAPITSQTLGTQSPPVTVTAKCPVGSMVTGVQLESAGCCPHGCGTLDCYSYSTIGRLIRIGVMCRKIQQ
jgi:hypothetical protein